jgi:hypothetical protein
VFVLREWTTLDAYLTTYLERIKGLPLTLKIEQHGTTKVVFSFPSTPELHKAIDEYNRGATVEAALFARGIKDLKTQVIELKKENDGYAYRKRQAF